MENAGESVPTHLLAREPSWLGSVVSVSSSWRLFKAVDSLARSEGSAVHALEVYIKGFISGVISHWKPLTWPVTKTGLPIESRVFQTRLLWV